MTIRFLSAGDSHGPALVGIIEGLPAGVRVRVSDIQRQLSRRRKSYGRSSRQMIEKDDVEFVGGMWKGRTTGAPLAIILPNRGRTVQGKKGGAMGTVFRPGHADFAGTMKYGLEEIPPVSERASARSTAMRVAIGTVARTVLAAFGIDIVGHVVSIGEVTAQPPAGVAEIKRRAARSPVFCSDAAASRRMVAAIKEARAAGHSLGGCAEVVVTGLCPGLGSHVAWDRKLDARLAAGLMSIQSVKAVEIGDGLQSHRRHGVDAQDAMSLERGRVHRPTNRAGGIEGGMTNGENVVARAYAKPIPTAQKRLPSFDMDTLAPAESPYVRSDVCVVPALSVIAESVAAWELLGPVLEKFGGDTLDAALAAHRAYVDGLRKRLRK